VYVLRTLSADDKVNITTN